MVESLWGSCFGVLALLSSTVACSPAPEEPTPIVIFEDGVFTLKPVDTRNLATDDVSFKISVNGTEITGAGYTVKIGDGRIELHSSNYDDAAASGPTIRALEAIVDGGDAAKTRKTEVVLAVEDGGKATLKGALLQAWVDLFKKGKLKDQFADKEATDAVVLGDAFKDIITKLPKKTAGE